MSNLFGVLADKQMQLLSLKDDKEREPLKKECEELKSIIYINFIAESNVSRGKEDE